MEGSGASLFRNPNFVKLWAGQGISFVGDAISMVAMVILVVRITGSASAVGGLLIARLIPTLASPLVGVLADRLDRRAILVASDLVRAALIIGVMFTRDLVVLYILVFLLGASRTLFNPTIRAAFPTVVGGGDLTRANAIISGTFSTSIAVGPALGGLLVATVGLNAAFLIDAATYLISAAFLVFIPLPRPEPEEETGFVQELRGGFEYLKGARLPLTIVIGAFLLMLTVDVTVPAKVFLAKETFGAGDAGYGLLVSLWGGGMVLGSVLMAVLGSRVNLLLFYFVSIFTAAVALAATSISPTFALALGALTVAGISNGVDNITTDTILQEQVPDVFLGRVFSVRFMAFSVAEILAYGAGGLLVDATGPRSAYLLAGGATAVAGVFLLLLIVTAPRKQLQSKSF